MRRQYAFAIVLGLSAQILAAASAQPDGTSTKPAPRVINVTADSAPGWVPTVDQSDLAEATARAYLASEDSGNVEKAYSYFTDINKQHVPFAEYGPSVRAFDAKAGPIIGRQIVKVTWTKDPAQAPFPGIYAAMDLVSRFAHVDRHCGFIILYQSPSGGAFQVMREESNVLDNASAESMAREHGRSFVDNVWAQLSANCPNYPGFSPQP